MRHMIAERNRNLFSRRTGAVFTGQCVRLLLFAIVGQQNPLTLVFAFLQDQSRRV